MNTAQDSRASIPVEAIFLRGGPDQTLQARLIAGVVEVLLAHRVAPGTRMPGTRALAAALGLSRMTVTLVYQELAARGYLDSRPRSGFEVARDIPALRVGPGGANDTAPDVAWDRWLEGWVARKRVIRKPADWRTYPYPFIYGQGDPRLFDHAAWRDCARRALSAREFGELAFDLLTRDDPMLIHYICTRTLPRRGILARPEEVLITVGSQNALFLSLDILARPDRLAVIEEPGYPDFVETLRRSDAPWQCVPVDQDGLDPATLPARTRLVVATPSHNIPTGATMPLQRRLDLLARAEADDFLIIEDDYDYEMSYLAPPLPALKSLDRHGRVIYLGSFSKSLFPGLRIGYLVASEPMIAAARDARAIMLRHPPTHLQRTAAHFLALGHYDAHVVRLREEMQRRRSETMDALGRTAFRIAGTARDGGASVWLSGPDDIDSMDLAEHARRRGVLIEPGAVFFETPPRPCPFFRLGYGSISSEKIRPGIEQLQKACDALRHGGR
ncbi:PLP-dependent aminotransferase family protein [Paracoccus luteus]|uniref:MocR-like pyridoxine biosynthesis transcription factor PdxR n=1 Tax=Paracoccus luteus TaxID=2508543 RepID=UPI00106FE88A|nr:PLP-dependent aminotransferase family protein [Paracoccus luteus]